MSQPKTELNTLLQKTLEAIREMVFAHTVALFWVKGESQQIILEAKSTSSQVFSSGFRLTIGSDILSKVAISGKPEIISNINPSSVRDLLSYYESNETVKSCVAVPVFFPQNPSPVAVLCVDSKNADSFGKETLSSLQRFSEIISLLVKNYTEKFDLFTDAELLQSLRSLEKIIHHPETTSPTLIIEELLNESKKFIVWDVLSLVTFDKTSNQWSVQKVLNTTSGNYLTSGHTVDMQNSIAGYVIQSQKNIIVENLSEQNTIRFSKDEHLEQAGSLLCLPISLRHQCFGVLLAERKEPFSYSQHDADILHLLIGFAAVSLAMMDAGETITEYVSIEPTLHLLKEKHFLLQIENELQRATDFNESSTSVVIAIDKAQKFRERFGETGFETIRQTVSGIIRASIRSYDVAGASSESNEIFYVLLVHSTSTDAQIWGEKLRKSIASTIISIEGKTFSVTASIGMYNVQKAMGGAFAISYAKTALNKAVEQGENSVKIL